MNIEEVASSYFQTDPTLLEPGAWSFSAGFSRHRTPQRKTPQQSTQSTRHPTGNWEGLIGLIRLILVVEFNQLIAIWDSGFVILLPQSSCGPETRITMVPGIATKTAARPVAWAPQPRNMFVFGAGFVGRYVSERLLAQGWLVTLTPHTSSSMSPSQFHFLPASLRLWGDDANRVHYFLISVPRLNPIPDLGVGESAGRSPGRAPLSPRRGS